MGHFRGILRGNRGSTSRLGSKNSGLSSHTDGWDCGVHVWATYNEKTKQDQFSITLTNGSGYEGRSKNLGTFTKDDLN